jgi:hypothetical protein
VPTTRYSLHGVPLESAMPLPELRSRAARPGATGPHVAIDVTGGLSDAAVRWFHEWRVASGPRGSRRRSWLSFGRRSEGYLLRFHELADFEVSAAGDRVVCRPARGLARTTLRHLLLDQVLPLVFSQSGRLVLHASAVHIDGVGSVAFAGPAGSGKSTLAAALGLRGCAVVADDSLMIAESSDALDVIPGYPGLRLWPDSTRRLGLERAARGRVAHYSVKKRVATSLPFHSPPSPLRAIFVLGSRVAAGARLRTQRLSPRDGLITLARYTYLMDVEDRGHLSRMFENLSTVVARVPVARLHFREGSRTLLTAADEVLAMARTVADS